MNGSKLIANKKDGKELLKILESSAAKGAIELIYTRRPDAYESYMKENGDAFVFISRNEEKAVGTCAELVRNVYINGERCKAAYICGLKKDANYEGSIGFGLELIRSLKRDDVDFYYCSVVADNEKALKMFQRDNKCVSIKHVSDYTTYILNPKARIKTQKHSFIFRKATEEDTKELIAFLSEEGKKKDLFPAFESVNEFYNLKYSDFYLLMDNNRILATAALWNQVEYKQYVVKKYRKLMNLIRVVNPLLSLLGYIKLPKENEPLEFPMLSFFVSRDDNETYYKIFLNELKKELSKTYGMFVIGLPENHFGNSIFRELPSVNFKTSICQITFPWSNKLCKNISPEKLFLECGLL